MKKIDYLILGILSVIVLIGATLVLLLSLGVIDISIVGRFLEKAITGAKTCNIIAIMSAILIIISLKGVFFTDIEDKDRQARNTGILMENGNGKLMISRATLENIVKSVVKEFDNTDDIKTLIQLDQANNLMVSIDIVVSKNVIIKDLTLNIQNKIKEEIKKTSDLDVKEVNVKIRNIATQNKKTNGED